MMIVAMLTAAPVELDHRAGGLPAAARLVPPGAADHRDRHVDRPVELHPGDAGAAQQADSAARFLGLRGVRHHDIAEADHHHASSRRSCCPMFWYIVNKTPLGRAQRATEQDRKMAALLGVDVDRTISVTFIMGAALAAVAGTMYLMYYGVVVFTDGFVPGVKAFTAAVLGGIGSLAGRCSRRVADRPHRVPLVRLFHHRLQGCCDVLHSRNRPDLQAVWHTRATGSREGIIQWQTLLLHLQAPAVI